MENASKALIMAAGILIGILILALMVTLFASAGNLSKSYEDTRMSTKVQQFNANFIKYVGQDLTIHEVITIYNFAKQNGIQDSEITRPSGFYFNTEQIKNDLNDANAKLNSLGDPYYKVEKIYKLEISEYNSETGYVSKIKINTPTQEYKCYTDEVNPITGKKKIYYKN